MDTRRHSGLWAQNPNTGLYERQSPTADTAPYNYYQPPPHTSTTSDRRSFAERAGTSNPTYDERLDTPPDPYRAAAESAAVKMNTRAALMAHEEVLDSPEHAELVKQLHEHEDGGAAGSEHFSKTAHFNDSLPASMAVGMGPTDSEHFSRTRHLSEAGLEEIPGNVQEGDGGELKEIGGTTSEDLAKTQHIDRAALPTASEVAPIPVDEDVPENLRTKQWSPPLESTAPEDAVEEPAAPASEVPVRRTSVSERSPLQKLERDSAKEEKRARVEEAENRAIQRQATLRSEKGRVVSDGSRRPSESTSDKYYQHSPRQVSAGSAALGGLPPAAAERFQRASEALKNAPAVMSNGIPAIAKEPRPYHHAPSEPRSLQSIPRRRDTEKFGGPAIAREPRPYHHAPAAPRSLDAGRRQSAGQENRAAPSQGGFGTPPIAKEPRPYHHAPDTPRRWGVAQYMYGNGQHQDGTPPIAKDPRPYHHAPETPRRWGVAQYMYGNEQNQEETSGRDGDGDMYRTASGRYKHRLRDAGYVGAAAAAAVGAGAVAYEATSGDQTQSVHESRKSEDLSRSNSKKLQKRPPQGRNSLEAQNDMSGKQVLQSDRIGGGHLGSGTIRKAVKNMDQPDPVSRDQVKTHHGDPLSYHIPPQTAAGQAAREQVGFDAQPIAELEQPDEPRHGRLGALFHRNTEPRSYQPPKPLEEWRGVPPLLLTLGELEFDQSSRSTGQDGKDSAWWESGRGTQRSSSSRQSQPPMAQYDGPYEEEAKLFRPPMFLKCGPLLRYTGIRREGQREIWRGSVMIVTEDEQSDYSTVPTLRLFAQPMDLLPSPSKHMRENGQGLPPELEDPVAGQVKVSRTGRPLYVRPVQDIEHGVDLSREENNQGLYAATRTPMLGPQLSSGPDGKQSQHITFQDKSRIKARDGEKAGRYKEIRAVRLHTERGFTFWRWSIEIELGSQQHRVAYRINRGPALGFWVPARGETMNMMFHSCNGFSLSVDPHSFSGPDPLWRDVLNKHQFRPFHVMIGGGDQIYNDAAMRDTTLFRDWLQTKNPESKHGADFSPEMQEELESFYLDRYSMWFSQGLFAMAGSQIPMVNLWDDHDIIDGYGSYPHHFMSTRVFAGIGAIAFKYYMLFQHQSLAAETSKEPSWLLGASPGPYINELSRHVFLDLGRKVKFLGVDCRTERMRDEILSEASYEILFNKCRAEIVNGETRHLIVLLGVPIAYPRLNFLENILTSRVMDPIKAIGRTGMLGGFVNKFDGGVEILDDLDDHWTAKHHKPERNWFIQELQELAAEKSVRVTILGGDVHLGAVGQFYTPKKFAVSKDRDHRYMPNVISSAIVNTPPPTMMADVLNRRNKIHHLDSETDEDLIPMFDVDVDGSKRNNKCLLPRRNYCTIREFQPGHTPPSTPPPERAVPATQNGSTEGEAYDTEDRDRRYPPGSMTGRTRSLTRGPANLIRRLSGSRGKNPPSSLAQAGAPGMTRSQSLDGPRPVSTSRAEGTDTPPRPSFHRRPSNMTEKDIRRAAARGGAPDEEGVEDGREPGHINLEAGLDICLNMEIDQHDPIGATQTYRLLVPALWYSGAPDINTSRFKSRRGTIMDRLRGRRNKESEVDSRSSSPAPPADVQNQRTRPPGEPAIATSAAPTSSNRYGADGTAEPRSGARPAQQPVDHAAAAYHQGYNLSAPPIGAPPPPTQQAKAPAYNNPYPQSGYRPPGSSIPQKHSQQVPQGQELDDYSDGSMTSDEYVDARDRQPRRFSKAERFFGIGDGGGGPGNRNSMQDERFDDGYAAPAKKRNWQIWK